MAEKGKYTTVSIPTNLAEKCRDDIRGTGFKNLSDYVAFILREITMYKDERENASSKDDKEMVIEKLKALGYIR